MTGLHPAQRVSAILLAAGESRRMGRDKLLLPYGNATLLERALGLLLALPFRQRLLVTTPARLAKITVPLGVTVVENLHPERGQSESLRLGVAAATGKAYMFFCGDQPRLTPAAVEALLAHLGEDRILYPTVDGKPRSPAIFPSRFRDELLALTGDTGGRRVRMAHPACCLGLEAEDPLSFADVDTWEAYQELLQESQEGP